SEVSLATNNWWSFSNPFAAEGLAYLSHQTSEFLCNVASPWQTTTNSGGPIGTWVQKYFLDVVDYAHPADPLARKAVNIPGALNGISHQGALLYTVGTHWTTNWSYSYTEYLDALAYDGVSAHLVDSLPLSSQWPHPVLVVATNIFVGQPGQTTSTTDPGPSS